MIHSMMAAELSAVLYCVTPKAMARAISTMMKVSFIQKLARRIRYSRKKMPNRWYSAQMKIAEIM